MKGKKEQCELPSLGKCELTTASGEKVEELADKIDNFLNDGYIFIVHAYIEDTKKKSESNNTYLFQFRISRSPVTAPKESSAFKKFVEDIGQTLPFADLSANPLIGECAIQLSKMKV